MAATPLQFLRHFPIGSVAASADVHFVLREGQNGNNPDHHGHVKEVQGHVEASQKQGDADVGEAPRPGEEQQDGGTEGGEPGVQRQRRQEEGHRCLALGYYLKK